MTTTTNPEPPAGRPKRATRRTPQQQAALIEDLEFLAATGETVPGAAARLHLHPNYVRDVLARTGRRHVFARLLANQDDRPYAGPRGVIARRAA